MTEKPETVDFSFNKQDAMGLIDVLSGVAGKLTRRQWGLLLSIFAAAADHVEVSPKETRTRGKISGVKVDGGVITDPRNREVEELRKQLLKAYMPARPRHGGFGDMVSPPKKKGDMVSPPKK